MATNHNTSISENLEWWLINYLIAAHTCMYGPRGVGGHTRHPESVKESDERCTGTVLPLCTFTISHPGGGCQWRLMTQLGTPCPDVSYRWKCKFKCPLTCLIIGVLWRPSPRVSHVTWVNPRIWQSTTLHCPAYFHLPLSLSYFHLTILRAGNPAWLLSWAQKSTHLYKSHSGVLESSSAILWPASPH